jgi:hypothetical protein
MKSDAEIFEPSLRLARQIIPELRDTPIYFLTTPDGMRHITTGCYAFYLRRNSAPIRERLIADGKWEGEGPIFCFNHPEWWSDFLVVATCIHELSHALPWNPPKPKPPMPTQAKWDSIVLELGFKQLHRVGEDLPLWTNHEIDFVRNALHLTHRAWRHGDKSFGWGDVHLAGSKYGLSDAAQYARALGTEVEEMIDATFEEIASTPVPAAFQELFNNDTKGK